MPPKKLQQRSSVAQGTNNDNVLSISELKGIANTKRSPESQLQAAAERAEAAISAHDSASSLRILADAVKDPTKREKYLRDAYDKESEAHGNSKKAKVLSSGAFQGTVGGGGIGMAVGAGLGTLVGTVVGTVATVPTTALGSLVGMGVGSVHGPWIKLPKLGAGSSENKGNTEHNEKDDETDPAAVPNPKVLRQAAEEIAEARRSNDHIDTKHLQPKEAVTKSQEKAIKKRPRKLEVRGKQVSDHGQQASKAAW